MGNFEQLFADPGDLFVVDLTEMTRYRKLT